MADALQVELVSPEKVIFSGEANMVITRTAGGGGELAFQAGALVESHTRIFLTDGTIQDVAVHRGFIEVSGNPTRVSILSDVAELADEIDIDRAKEALERHQLILKTESVEAHVADAVAGKARAQARLTATGTGFTA